jgi:hypothetical protein
MATVWEYMDVQAIYSQEQQRWIRTSRVMPGGEEVESLGPRFGFPIPDVLGELAQSGWELIDRAATGSITLSDGSSVSSWSFLFRRASGD